MIRTLISNQHLPGWTAQRTITFGDELERQEISDPDGVYVGTIVYVRRRHKKGGSTYGWRPEKQTRRAPTDRLAAIDCLRTA